MHTLAGTSEDTQEMCYKNLMFYIHVFKRLATVVPKYLEKHQVDTLDDSGSTTAFFIP